MRSVFEKESPIPRDGWHASTALSVLVFFGFALLSVLASALILLLADLLPAAGADLILDERQKVAGLLVLALLLGSIAYTLVRLSALTAGRPLRLALYGLAAGLLPYFFLPLSPSIEASDLRGQLADPLPFSTSTPPALVVVPVPVTGETPFPSATNADTPTPELITWLPPDWTSPPASPTPSPTWHPLYSAIAPLPTKWGLNAPTPTLRARGRRLPIVTATQVQQPASTAIPRPTITPLPTSTRTSVPTNTRTSVPTNTRTSVPTSTWTSVPTSTRTSVPTSTPTDVPTSTPRPPDTATPVPNTATPVPPDTATPQPADTATQAILPGSTADPSLPGSGD